MKFVLKTMNYVSKTMNLVLKTMNLVLKNDLKCSLAPTTWVTSSSFSKAVFEISMPPVDDDCVDMRNSILHIGEVFC